METFLGQITNLAQAVTRWIAIVTVPVAGATFGYHAFARKASHDESVAMQHSRAMTNTLKYGALVLASSTIVTAILSFFAN